MTKGTVGKITKSEFEKKIKNQRLVYSHAEGTASEVKVFFNSEDLRYYAMGPFGRWDSIVFYDLGGITLEELSEWIQSFETQL